MPTSLPTGTVSRTSAGTRTFPPESDRERAATTSTQPSRPPQMQVQVPPTTPRPDLTPSTVVQRRQHDAAVSPEHEHEYEYDREHGTECAAELRRENEILREYIDAQAAERQAIIERYERILDRRDAEESTSAPVTDTAAAPGALDSFRSTLSGIRSRVVSHLGLD